MLVDIKTKCPGCGEDHVLQVDPTQFMAWQEGALVQDAFPSMDDNDRERLLSGFCPACYTELSKEKDDEHEAGPDDGLTQ